MNENAIEHDVIEHDLDEFRAHESEVRYYCRRMPRLFERARNALVWDTRGAEYIDFLSACGSLNYGHNHPTIRSAAVAHLLSDGIVNGLDLHTEAKRRFMQAFRRLVLEPRQLQYRFQFTGPTGSNAVEAALKLARKATGRRPIVAFTNAFHGMSLGALSATGSSAARAGAGLPLDGVVRLPFDGYAGAGIAELNRFEQMVLDPSGGIDAPAGIIVETIQGEGGLNVASVAWLRRLSELAGKIGALLIVDDIQAGCGRSGSFFSFERAGIAPDIVCLAKSLSGSGLPMSMLLLKPGRDLWQPGEHNGTFRGNNLAFATATAALDLWTAADFVPALGRRSRIIADWMRRVVEDFPGWSIEPKGLGMMLGLRLPQPELADRIAQAAFVRGVLIETAGPRDEVLKIMPPLTIEDDILAEGLRRLRDAAAQVLRAAEAPSKAA